jgi:adenylate kinase
VRVICTGISGTDRVGYLQELAALARRRGHALELFDVREAMFQIARDVGEPIDEETVLDTFPRALVLLRAAALEQLSNVVQRAGAPRAPSGGAWGPRADRHPSWLLNTHAVFRWKNTLIPGFDPHYLERLRPDLFITITAGVLTVRERLRAHPRWDGLTIEDLLVWREEEQFATEEMARIHRKPQYLVGRQMAVESLYRLLFEPERRKVYLSYPMQHAGPAGERRLAELKARLGEQFVVFDPADVNDFVVEDAPAGQRRPAAPFGGELAPEAAGPFSERELRHISDQIVFRDYKLIAQSDFVVVYYDVPVPSPGVVSEMNYALHTGKRVYGIWLPPSEPSPFFTRYCSTVVRSLDDLFEHFARHRVSEPAGPEPV